MRGIAVTTASDRSFRVHRVGILRNARRQSGSNWNARLTLWNRQRSKVPAESAPSNLRRAADTRRVTDPRGRESPENAELPRPDFLGPIRRPAAGGGKPGDESGAAAAIHNVRKRRVRSRDESSCGLRSQTEAQERLQQWLDGKAPPASRAPKREQDRWLERD